MPTTARLSHYMTLPSMFDPWSPLVGSWTSWAARASVVFSKANSSWEAFSFTSALLRTSLGKGFQQLRMLDAQQGRQDESKPNRSSCCSLRLFKVLLFVGYSIRLVRVEFLLLGSRFQSCPGPSPTRTNQQRGLSVQGVPLPHNAWPPRCAFMRFSRGSKEKALPSCARCGLMGKGTP